MCSFSQKRHKGAGRPWGERCTTCSTPQMDLLCLLWGFTLSLRALPTSSVSQWGYKFSNRIHSKRDQQARPQKSYSSAYPCSHLPCPLQCDTALASSRKPSITTGTTSHRSFVKISLPNYSSLGALFLPCSPKSTGEWCWWLTSLWSSSTCSGEHASSL